MTLLQKLENRCLTGYIVYTVEYTVNHHRLCAFWISEFSHTTPTPCSHPFMLQTIRNEDIVYVSVIRNAIAGLDAAATRELMFG